MRVPRSGVDDDVGVDGDARTEMQSFESSYPIPSHQQGPHSRDNRVIA